MILSIEGSGDNLKITILFGKWNKDLPGKVYAAGEGAVGVRADVIPAKNPYEDEDDHPRLLCLSATRCHQGNAKRHSTEKRLQIPCKKRLACPEFCHYSIITVYGTIQDAAALCISIINRIYDSRNEQ